MVVFYQSQPVLLEEDLMTITCYDELLETLTAITSIPPENIKLIANGIVLSSELFSASILKSKVIM